MAKFGEWIPITYREMTDEEKQAKADKLRIDPEALTDNIIYTCEMPDDEQQVIITTDKNDVFMTKFYKYGIYEYFELFEDPGDALAWMPAPEPFSNSEMMKPQTQKFADDDTAYGGLASAT